MSFLCALSGEVPTEPVVSPKSGKLYEKRILLKYLEENGKEPGTDHDLSETDLIALSKEVPVVAPRPPAMTSVPSILSVLQNEWDAIVLESYTLKQQYQKMREELTHALYQHDAACRVIARLMTERDEARKALADIKSHLSQTVVATSNGTNAASADSMDIDGTNGSEQSPMDKVVDNIKAKSEELSKARKKRKLPKDITPADTIRTFTQTSSVDSLHSSTHPGILSVASDISGNYILTAGIDKHAEIYNVKEEKTVSTLKGHTKKVNTVAWCYTDEDGSKDLCLTGSADKTVRVWAPSEKPNGWVKKSIIKEHAGEVTALDVHPCRKYFASASLDSTWCLHDIETTTTYFTAKSEESSGFASAAFHPDGLLFATGTLESTVAIWDVKSQGSIIAKFTSQSQDPITSISFSENGYHLAAAHGGIVDIWDLRKQATAFTINLREQSPEQKWNAWGDNSVVKVAKFDRTGAYLAIGGEDTRVYQAKGWHELYKNDDNTMEVSGVTWTHPLSCQFATTSMDRTIRFYGAPQ